MQEETVSRDWLEQIMREALREASRAEALGEVPVGAVVELDGKIIGRGHNRPISAQDPTAHAEITALREAARTAGNYRLPGARLFVTIEPCLMCAGGCLHARIQTLIFGAPDPKTGAVRSCYRLLDDPHHNHRVEVIGGVLEEDCAEKLRAFFKERREGTRGG
jgi:tRNA(adenine34) deaminase